MKSLNRPNTPFVRPTKDATIRVRCSGTLKSRLYRIAAMKEADLSDEIRAALNMYAAKFEQHFN